MNGKLTDRPGVSGQAGQVWLAPAVLTALLALAAVLGVLPLAGAMLILPVAAGMLTAYSGWVSGAVLCAAGCAAGMAVFPQMAWPTVLIWCIGNGLVCGLKMKKAIMRPILRTGVCLAAWAAGLITLLQISGGQIVNGLAQSACDLIDRSPEGTEILLRAYSAGYARLQGTEAITLAFYPMTMTAGVRTQLLYSLRVSLEEILPSLICSVIVYHTALTVLLGTVMPDWLRRKHGEKGEFSPMEQWYMPRRLGWAVFALCMGWVIAFLAEDGIGAYLGWMCADVFRAAFMLQGICWMQWMGKRMGIGSTMRNIWSVVLSVLIPLIPILMGMIDQRRDARHLRPDKEVEQE